MPQRRPIGKKGTINVFPYLQKAIRLGAFMVAGLLVAASASYAASAQSERYVPGIWVDPDGCEHWAIDDGWEGYMTPNVTPDGIPVCRRVQACLVESSDQLFAVDRSYINAANRKRLADFFRTAGATAYTIYGHTDSDASDAYNMGLSMRRANAVAQIAQSAGARISKVRGFGERQPIATNRTAYGKSRNRRVEIICIK